jgi:ABC-type transport system substrate-binding protein
MSYWQRHRLTRRRLLQGSALAGAGVFASTVLACGPGRRSDLLSLPADSSAAARPGGTLKSVLAGDTANFDPLASPSAATHSQIGAYTYPRLLRFVPGVYPNQARGDLAGDLAESFELSPDGLQITLRLRQGPRWEQRAPTSGRAPDAEDVIFSWNKFAPQGLNRHDAVYHAEQAPGAPFANVTATDARTVVFRLRQPDASALALLAAEGLLYVMPRESDGDFDPQWEVRGYGPWLLSPDSRLGAVRIWTRNPDYHVKGRPFIDRIEQPVLPDYAARLAQFRGGMIWPSVASQHDVIATKRELPQLLLTRDSAYTTAPGALAFGYDGVSPWKDERLRQAVSLLLDRETIVDVKTQRAQFADAGLDLGVRYHSAIGAGWEGSWVDPTDAASFGNESRYFRYDPAEAHRLMSAAGYADGLDTLLHYNGGPEYGTNYSRTAELLSGLLAENGVRAALDPHAYQSDWLPNYQLGYATVAANGRPLRGFAGIAYRSATQSVTAAAELFAALHSQGTRFHGLAQDGRNPTQGDPELSRLLENLRSELGAARRQTLALDAARLVARRAYAIPMLPFAAQTFSLTWPVLVGHGALIPHPAGSPVTETALNHWLDTTKAPLNLQPS